MSITVFENISPLREWIASRRSSGRVIGFVPTMGALHAGHMSLINRAKERCDDVIVSVFVNPTQFNNPDDLKKYPRTIDEDIRLLKQASCDVLFYPSEKEVYPVPEKRHWDFGLMSHSLEAHFRPGHFDGVLTVVKRFFEIVEPDIAYFGEKDFQQLSLIRKMAEFENFPIEVIGCPIVREEDGLAMSSRNLRLSPEQRRQAIAISKTLFFLKENRDRQAPKELAALGWNMLMDADGIVPEYLEIVDGPSFIPVHDWLEKTEPVVLLAAYVGDIRLIDNMAL